MKKKICKNCADWERHTKEYDSKNAGSCSSDNFVYAECAPINGLGYMDCEGYSASFETGENFGCIHFKKKIGEEK